MAKYAIIENEIVVNTILADDQETANLFGHAVECKNIKTGIGWSYDGVNFIEPHVPDINLAEKHADQNL